MMTIYQITPCAKPRMTQQDKWKERPVVMRYRAFRERIKLLCVELPLQKSHIIFHIPMPSTWSKKRKAKTFLQPHQNRPDLDNLLKGLFDAVDKEDSYIWDFRATKIWGYEGKIIILQCQQY